MGNPFEHMPPKDIDRAECALDPPLKNGKYVSLGRCGAAFCPHCGRKKNCFGQ